MIESTRLPWWLVVPGAYGEKCGGAAISQQDPNEQTHRVQKSAKMLFEL